MTTERFFGTSYKKGEEIFYLPFEGLHVNIRVINFVAEVQVVQFFVNNQDEQLNVFYEYPMDEKASVCGFEAEISKKQHLVGQIMPKHVARQEFQQAKAAGESAVLLEQVVPDIFRQEIANIPPKSRFIVRLLYVTELEYEPSTNSATFHFPTSIAPRYQQSLVPMDTNWTTSALGFRVFDFYRPNKKGVVLEWIPWDGPNEFIIDKQNPGPFSFSMVAEMSNEIANIKSTSHAISFQSAAPNKGFATFFERETNPMGSDLSIQIEMKLETSVSCVMELGHRKSGCAMLTIIPNEEEGMSLSTSPEIIFLIDNSGSMDGVPIDLARRALLILLSSLPTNCYFNIIKFGSNHIGLFDTSTELSNDSLKSAKSFVKMIGANMGGTELYVPLKNILGQQNHGRPKQVFILTDGQVSNTDAVIELCHQFAILSSPQTPQRVFSVGIGDSVSHELVSGMARAGLGTSEFICGAQLNQHGSEMERKLILQLRLATSVSNALDVNWGNASNVRQAPFLPPPVHFGRKLVIYAFFDSPPPPLIEVIISGKRKAVVVSTNKSLSTRTIHLLGSRKIVRDLEEGTSSLHYYPPKVTWLRREEVSLERVQTDLINLCCEFGIVSSGTSFIALERSKIIPFAKIIPPKEYPRLKKMKKAAINFRKSISKGCLGLLECVFTGSVFLICCPFNSCIYLYDNVECRKTEPTPLSYPRERPNYDVKIILLGPDNAGKSTILKQLSVITNRMDIPANEVDGLKERILSLTLESTRNTLQENSPYHPLLEVLSSKKEVTEQMADLISTAWTNGEIKLDKNEPLSYYLDKLSLIVSPNYVPSVQDWIVFPDHSSRSSELKAEIDGVMFILLMKVECDLPFSIENGSICLTIAQLLFTLHL